MDAQKIAREIGLIETAVNIAAVRDSRDVVDQVGASMPLPAPNIREDAEAMVKWLLGFHKKKYMFLTPEIALAELLAEAADEDTEIIFAVPCDMDEEAKERLNNNLPRGVRITILEEPFFPIGFFPGNGIMVVCGYSADERTMVLTDTYRMAEHYSGFRGKTVFLPFVALDTAQRFDGWMEIGRQQFSAVWRNEE